MPVQYGSGLEDPVFRDYMMSSAQQGAANHPVTSMGLGIQSNVQRRAAGRNQLADIKKLIKLFVEQVHKRKEKKKKTSTGQEKGAGKRSVDIPAVEPRLSRGMVSNSAVLTGR